MKLSMEITLAGLVNALRRKEHDLADAMMHGGPRQGASPDAPRDRPADLREADNDLGRG